jgi:hypothetical protein
VSACLWLDKGRTVSRYYFHIRDGQFLVPDEEGTECCTLSAAHEEARASATDLLNAAMRSRSSRVPGAVEIEDEDGNAVHPMVPALWMH